MKKIFIILLMLCSFSLFSCQENEFSDDVPISERRSYDGTLRDDTFYFVYLTEEESKKNLEYKVSDFDLKNLYSIETFLRADNYDDLWLENGYRAVLRFLFKNLSYEIAEENESKMWNDKRINSIRVGIDYNLPEYEFGGIFYYLETNLDINEVYFLDDASYNDSSNVIVNDKESFELVKNDYKYKKVMSAKTGMNYTKDFLFNKYNADFFADNSLLFIKLDISYLDAGFVMKSIYSENEHINIKYNTYTHYNSKSCNNSCFYLIEINGKVQNKDIEINGNNLYYYQ